MADNVQVHDGRLLWGPGKLVTGTNKVALVILNVKDIGVRRLDQLWGRATWKICADGGANRLFDFTDGNEKDQFIPDAIVGDLDSLRDDVKIFYEAEGCTIRRYPEQDTHDLDKALLYLAEVLQNVQELAQVVIIGAFGGRIDQEMANFNMLYRWFSEPTFSRLVLASGDSQAFLLGKGTNHILWDRSSESGTCGLIPLGNSCESVTTTGLKWDLDCQRLAFGALVSSSNEMDEDTIVIHTDDFLVWTNSFKGS
eukprot:CAMPEP_0184559650 /NCGR_PEP_ID=MMETSP0199_2-20130426/46536_1 /TAXON_ID=1112570 /ORGANISM="Thraustochytrium sp., Strain LLF1b" /LENGTH=253 /DNA_ID=CAMNT_0026956945 /DNA_START=1609 /DNA_END=2370 /DNA_ORIENTATION=-